jgi:hypothetical protein
MKQMITEIKRLLDAFLPLVLSSISIVILSFVIRKMVSVYSPRETAIAHPSDVPDRRQTPETPETPARKGPRMNLQLWQIGLLIAAGIIVGGIIQVIVLVVRKAKEKRAATPES